MRTIIFVLIACTALPALAQDDSRWCYPASSPFDQCYIGRKYNYLFCVGNRLVEDCVEFPNDQPWPVFPLKIDPSFFCVEFSGFYPSQLSYQVKMPDRWTGAFPVLVWQRGAEDDCIDDAVRRWQCLCPPTPKPSKACCFQVEYSTDESMFSNPKNQAAVTRMTRIPGGTCELDCNATRIYINMTEKYTDYDPQNYPQTPFRRFFSTQNVLGNIDQSYEVVNLCDVIRHEVGHVFGIGHHNACGIQGPNNRPTQGLMSAEALRFNAPPAFFTQDDVCAYRRLYCFDVVTHAGSTDTEHAKSGTQENYPNPFGTTTTIPFTVAKLGMVQLLVYNELGTVVATLIEQELPAGSYTQEFNSATMPQGTYWYVLRVDNTVQVRSMVIVR